MAPISRDDDSQHPADSSVTTTRDEAEENGSVAQAAAEEGKQTKSSSHKSYVAILDQEIREGVDELERPNRGLLLSGLSAGLDVGFSVLALGVVGTLALPDVSDLTRALLGANAYALGFLLVIFGRSELFTEHTTLAVLPLLDGRTTARHVARVWGLIYVGNLVGIAIFSAVLSFTAPSLGSVEPRVLADLARHLVDHSWWVTTSSAVLAGWLMGLASWLVTAGRDTTSQILFVWIVTGFIGFAGLHHCILGTGEVLSALFTGAPITLGGFSHFLFFTTLGNIIGGIFFVAIVKYGHASVVRPGLRDPARWRAEDD